MFKENQILKSDQIPEVLLTIGKNIKCKILKIKKDININGITFSKCNLQILEGKFKNVKFENVFLEK